MITLAVDTSTNTLAIAVCKKDELLVSLSLNSKLRHASTMMPNLIELLQKIDLKPQDLELLAVAVGPGSYTGLRIGVSGMKALAYALKLPLYGISTLRALALTDSSKPCLASLDARSGRVFAGIYQEDRQILIDQSIDAKLLKEQIAYQSGQYILKGTGSKIIDAKQASFEAVSAVPLARLAYLDYLAGKKPSCKVNYCALTQAERLRQDARNKQN